MFLVAGRRLVDVVSQMGEIMPDREAVVCRELTKKFEEVVRGPLSGLTSVQTRGEAVLIIGPGEPVSVEKLEVGPNLKSIAAALSERWGCKKSEAYSVLVELEESRR